MKIKLITISSLLLLMLTTQLFAGISLSQADSLVELRNAQFDSINILADSTHINQAIHLYQEIIANSAIRTEKHEAIWKILSAYYFKGLFTTLDNDSRKKIFSEGIQIGEKYLPEFPESVEIHCWLGILWGYWGEVSSQFASARAGVPDKVKSLAEKTIALDETYLEAGGYRLLGRLHFKVPKIPLFMSWPSKTKSIEYLEKAHQMAPSNLFNTLYLAEVLLDQEQEARARQLLNEIINTKKLQHGIAADAFVKRQAKILLNKNRH